MKPKLLSLTLALSSIVAVAQTQTIRFHENMDKLDVSTFVAKDGVTYTNLSFEGAIPSLGESGRPDLPKIRHLIALPENVAPTIKVKGYTTREFPLKELGTSAPLAPVQPVLNKNQRAEDIPFAVDRDIYTTDAFIQNDIATVKVLGTLRGIQIAQVEITPVDYNPLRGIIRQFSDIDVEVEYDAPTSEIAIPAHLQSPYFDVIYKALSNGDNVVTRTSGDDYPDYPDLTKYPVRMLIVTDRMFEETIKPYVEWKTQKGFIVDVAYTDEIGYSSSSIESYVQNCYENAEYEGKAAPSFFVIVGDVDQVPASEEFEFAEGYPYMSDFMYAQMNKGWEEGAYERFPEMYYGRISAETTEQLEAIIDKVLCYEKYQFDDPSFLGRATAIAGVDPGSLDDRWCKPKIKYLVENVLTAERGYTTVNAYGIEEQNYAGCYDSERFRVSLMTYNAHSDQYYWDTPRLSKATVEAANNEKQYPLVIANSCLSGDFAFVDNRGKNVPCIGEEFLRKPKGGAIAYIGSSPVSNWVGDHWWALGKKIDENGELTPENTTVGAYEAPFVSDYVSVAGILFCGNLAVTKGGAIGIVEQFWTGYNILGDPSLIPYFGEGSSINAAYASTIPVGSSSLEVKAPERSLVALSHEGKLLSTAFIGPEGAATLSFDAINTDADLMLVITKPQHIPIITTIAVGKGVAIEDVTVSSLPETIEVFNLQGVRLRALPGEMAERATDDLAPGTYLVVSISQTDRKVEKVIVK